MEERRKDNDHDLLIEIKTQVIRLISDVNELKTNLVGRVEHLEIEKTDCKEFKDLEKEVYGLQKWRYVIVGLALAIGIITTLSGYIYLSEQARQDQQRADIIKMIGSVKD